MAIDSSLTETTFYDEVLRYGLYLAAIIQLVCIGSVFILPGSEEKDNESSDEESSEHGSPISSAAQRAQVAAHKRKQDKKKRR